MEEAGTLQTHLEQVREGLLKSCPAKLHMETEVHINQSSSSTELGAKFGTGQGHLVQGTKGG